MSLCFQTSWDCFPSLLETPMYSQWAGLAAWFEFLFVYLLWQKRPQLVSKLQSTEQRCVLKDRNSWASWRLYSLLVSGLQTAFTCSFMYVTDMHIQFYKLSQRGNNAALQTFLYAPQTFLCAPQDEGVVSPKPHCQSFLLFLSFFLSFCFLFFLKITAFLWRGQITFTFCLLLSETLWRSKWSKNAYLADGSFDPMWL